MFCDVKELEEFLFRELGYSDPQPAQSFKQVRAAGDETAIATYPLLGKFATGAPAIWVMWAHAPKVGSGLHCFVQPLPKAGSSAHHNWTFSLFSVGEGAEAGMRLNEAFKRIQETLPIALHVDSPYMEQKWQGLTYSLPRHLSAGPFDYAR